MSLHGNTYEVDPALAGRKVELVFDPFDLTSIEVRSQGRPPGTPSRTSSAATPTPRPAPSSQSRPAPPTGIDYLGLLDAAHDTRLAGGAISYAGLPADPAARTGQLPGQMTIDEALAQENAVTIEKLQAHYGFTRMPFRRDLAPGMLHRHAAHAEAVARISWCITEHALGVITGEVGAGKTVALRAALAGLDASRHTVIYLGNPAVGVRGIYHAIVTALGGVPPTTPPSPPGHGPPRPRARRTRPHPRPGHRRSPPARTRPARGRPHAHQPRHGLRLPARLPADRPAHPTPPDQARHLRRPRPAHRRPLHHARHDRKETASYLSHHLKLAGRSDPLFTDDATALIHATSRGLPRAVNNLAIQALIAAYADRKAIVDESTARTAAAEVTAD